MCHPCIFFVEVSVQIFLLLFRSFGHRFIALFVFLLSFESSLQAYTKGAREPGSVKFPWSQPQDKGGTWVLDRYGLLLILVLDFALNNHHMSYLSIYLGKKSLQNMPGLSIYSLNWLHIPTKTERKSKSNHVELRNGDK